MTDCSAAARIVRLVVAAAVLMTLVPLVVTGTTSAASATTRPAVGVHVHGTWSTYTDEQRIAVLDRLAEAGVEWMRLDLGWASYEEKCSGCRSQWYVDRADAVIDAARARGIKVLAQVGRTPAWANGGQGTAVPPQNMQEFGRFMGWLSSHLRGRVDAYELWNEPNLTRFWRGTTAQFAELTHAGYRAVKGVDPAVPVVLGGVSYNDSSWLREAYVAGVGGSFDILATHPYLAPSDLGPEVPDTKGTNIYLLTHVAKVRELMLANGDGAKQIWFTEFGWSSHPNSGTEANWNRGVSEQEQGDYLVRTIDFVAANYPYVTNVFWYNDRDRGTSTAQIDNYGLLRHDLTPKPAYHALRQRLATGGEPSAPRLVGASDTGSSNTDGVTATADVTVEGTTGVGSAVSLLVNGVEQVLAPVSSGR